MNIINLNQYAFIVDKDKLTLEKECSITGEKYSVTIDRIKYLRWIRGEHIQNIFPDLTPDQREFIMTGITPEEWSWLFSEEEE